jgi:hypothetical protein
MQLRPVDLRTNYRERFAAFFPDADGTQRWDVMKSDATLIMRVDQVAAARPMPMPALPGWPAAPSRDFSNCAAGTWGPEDAQRLLAQGPPGPPPLNFELTPPFRSRERNAELARILEQDFGLCQESDPVAFSPRPFRPKFADVALRSGGGPGSTTPHFSQPIWRLGLDN